MLIVEDDFLVAAHLEDIVQGDLNADPIGVSTVAEALEINPDRIDFAFLDIKVRDGMSFEVARKLRDCEIPFIFVSGNDNRWLPEDLKGAAFLAKPVAPGRLVRLAKTMTSAFDQLPNPASRSL